MRTKTKTIHMAKHMEDEPVKEGKKQKLPENRLLKLFTILAEAKDSQRIKSTETLLKYLLEQQAKTTEGLCEDVTYAVNRLVLGLASGRKFARLGYSVALCQLIRSVEEVDTKLILDCMDNKIKTPTSSNASKKEQANAYLGKVFGYLALVNSQQLFSGSKAEMSQVVEELLSLSSKRSYLNHLCLNALSVIISQVKTKAFREFILPRLEDQLTAGWTECTPDRLCLLLTCSNHHKEVIRGQLTEHWGSDDLLAEKHWTHLAAVVLKSTVSHVSVHAVNSEILACLLDQPLHVIKFWNTVVHPLLEAKINPWPKRVLGLFYSAKLLPKLDSPEKLLTVLHPDMTSILAKCKSKRKSHLTDDQYKLLQSVIQGLQGLMRDSSSADVQLTIIKSLVKSPGSCSLVSHILGNNFTAQLQPEVCKQLKKETMKVFTQQSSWLVEADDITDEVLTWCIHELSSLVTNSNIVTSGNQCSKWQLNILQFLFLHSFYTVTKASSDIPHCDAVDLELSFLAQKGIVDNVQKAIHKLITFNAKGQSKYRQFCEHQDVLWGLLQYADRLVDAKDHVKLKQESFDEERSEQLKKILSTMQNIRKKRSSEDKVGPLHAFELLFFYHGLQLFLDPKADTEVLQDLHMCYKKSIEKRKSKVQDDGPDWMSVVTELLVSLMFKDQVLSRVIARDAMACLSNHVTSESLHVIIESVQQTSIDKLADDDDDEEEEGEMEGEDQEDEEDDDDDEVNVDPDVPTEPGSSDEEDEKEEEEKEEDESDIEEEEDVTVTDELKQKLKAALGNAAAADDDESEEGEEEEKDVEMTDAEMSQMDEVLADAFRWMRGGSKSWNKEKKLQLVNFRIRILDLLEAIIRNCPKVSLVKEMLVPLLELTEKSRRDKQAVKLGNSTHSLLQQMFKVKSFIRDSDVDGDELLELFSQLMALASGKVHTSLVSELAKSCLMVVRILLNLHDDHTGPSPLKTRSKACCKQEQDKQVKGPVHYQEGVVSLVQQGLEALFQHKSGHCPASFFHTIINRYPLMFWSLATMLQETMVSKEIKVYPKTQAASILSGMITKLVVSEIGETGMEEFVQEMKTTASQVLSQMEASQVKQEFVRTLLDICWKVNKLSPLKEQTLQILGEEDLTKLAEMKKSFNHDVAALYRKLTVNSSVPNSSAKKRKKEKKKKNKLLSEDQSPEKKAKLESQSVVNGNSGENLPETVAELNTPGSEARKKKKKKSRKSLSNEGDEQMNEVVSLEDNVDSQLSNTMEQEVDQSKVETPNTSHKKKKNKKRKSGAGLDLSLAGTEGLVNGSDVEMNGIVDSGDMLRGGMGAVTPSHKKKKGRKSTANEEDDKFSPRYTRSMR